MLREGNGDIASHGLRRRRFDTDDNARSTAAATAIADVEEGLVDGIQLVVSTDVAESGARRAGDRVVETLEAIPDVSIATLVAPIREMREVDDVGRIKVVVDARGHALYLSRGRIPHFRDPASGLGGNEPRYFKWMGLTAYRQGLLAQLATLPETPLAKLEGIDLLHALEHGFPIAVVVVEEPQ